MYEDFEYGPITDDDLGELGEWDSEYTVQLVPAEPGTVRDLELVLMELEIAAELFLAPEKFGVTREVAFGLVASRIPLWFQDAVDAQALIDSLLYGS